jgi:hypothetical protein
MKRIELNALGVLLCFIGLAILSMLFFAAVGVFIVLMKDNLLDLSKLQDQAFIQEAIQTKSSLQIIQSFASIGMFLIPSIIAVRIFKGYSFIESLHLHKPKLTGILIAATLIFFGVLMLSGLLAEINSLVPTTAYWKNLETKNLAAQKLLIQGEGLKDLFFSLVVVAFLPAFLEELAFRGFGLHVFNRLSKNAHLSVFFQAVVFAFVHFNITQMLPIFGIGLLFGYLAFYTKSIWYGVIIHFLNNAFAVFALFYADKYAWAKSLNSEEHLSPIFYILGIGVLAFGLYIFFKKTNSKQELYS